MYINIGSLCCTPKTKITLYINSISILKNTRSSHCGAAEANLTRNHEVVGSIPELTQWVKDPVLLWLWCRLEAVAPIRTLAWESPYAVGAALKIYIYIFI